ncbi:MAG: hypothetical protein J0H86_14430 [Xanthomonadaceae bacterium]|nr:hypothetical protein [Xanthomonadaceae bacterium]
MADTPRIDIRMPPVRDLAADRRFVDALRAAIPPPRTKADEMAELAHKLAPHLEPLLGPSRTGMTRNLLPPPFIPASEPSRRHTGAMSISQLSANEYIAAAVTFLLGLGLGVLLSM